MKRIEVESFSDDTNAAVIKLLDRKFPGLLLQGDSLKTLLDSANEVLVLSRNSRNPDLEETATELARIIEGYVKVYERTLEAHGKPLPY